ncbi:MAG TPA: bifunctional 23S rRNA (guanine(2069)-N(7))-methyltransferase RlmK/23S rRNA (guanine(2445)-N(2))-methyltransferase RlmL [Methylophaga aminisulfidivorans]|uniref:bifunctional 23S rRNA (guanine(2069)-N(7))-methyltransferase RlmK/23S rRNA (guanine(2445)-N(2))-methyltransferase RlmL n=1 Tax=Methylophaga TaxID=40222 RepID=UPI001772A1A9|nr:MULTISPECIES: bifunctional 23S rRNA (guanine(2069)-N(7))-methyltransferase RlmK/23S rRNA (guanine(2445)-N(2))-methyltransferase RlmL [Methylophaga]HIC45735.1 bifunctional 23S rRNA (guanine(2069)-N(7))-methyltransferase RlmK/23S rRNA (guanine(2445)-N(2))-methyltransferase RlmL [Methylophaga sp.]HIM39643.1 bifunctional 23S rRNA (guanine(2069)-N(7))-methyltransferase RlmK/23S rRNA (guanine(2445)-N(2))-methyltransferase RlmL [Methylophaga aminisulfidivorans]
MAKQHKFTVTAARGMLPLLAEELKQLGIKNTKQDQGNIRFTGTLADAYTVCLWSRVAIRVLLPIAHLQAETPEQLYEGINALPWEDHINELDSTIAVDFNSFRSKIKHTQYGAQRVKDAIVDRFRTLFGQRPSVDLYQPDVRINVYLKHNQATVSIDLSGESLHKRGYRVSNTAAPLKEHLAAAILLSAEWPKLARQGWALIDPMCGSGTFLIEAAMMAADIAPGILRDYYGFSFWKQHDKDIWKQLKADAERRRQSGLARCPVIVGGDADASAVEAAKNNIAEARLSDRIHVSQRDLLEWPRLAAELPKAGLFVCNPPYGERIGRMDELHYLYESLGNIINESFAGWRTTLITDNAQLGKFTGLTLFDTVPFDNGPIACDVLFYRAPRPVRTNELTASPTQFVDDEEESREQAPVEMTEQGAMFANRLKKNKKHLAKWARKSALSCYRVYDADLPDYALAIDLYDDHIHVQEYAPPKQIDPEKAVERLQEAMQIIPEVFEVPVTHVALKVRKKQRGKEQYEAQAAKNQRFEVRENGLRFWVNLTDYLDTGLFLDHRDTRQLVRELAKGKNFLNLFSYTGSASVYAAAGQARSTTSVDMSNTYLAWAEDNMKLNGFVGEQHQYIRANCIEWLEQAQEDEKRYGLIFLDPPTFSNSSRMEGVFDIQRDHSTLIKQAGALLTSDGELIFSTNRRDFELDSDALNQFVIEDISTATIPRDFERNKKIHRCWRIKPRA